MKHWIVCVNGSAMIFQVCSNNMSITLSENSAVDPELLRQWTFNMDLAESIRVMAKEQQSIILKRYKELDTKSKEP
jgi:hypothetical protein